jgi:hypothetical protein
MVTYTAMDSAKVLFTFLLITNALFCCYAEDHNVNVSTPIDFKVAGLNKVLCMKNGNTLLFHFEPNKALLVKVFDSSHKEIYSKKHSEIRLNTNYLNYAVYKALYEIDGEAVLFLEQSQSSKKQLIRVRIDGHNGSIIEESIIVTSVKISEQASFYVIKNKSDDGYAILCSRAKENLDKCNVNLLCFSNKHEQLQTVAIPLNSETYDHMAILGAEAQQNGIGVTICLYKLTKSILRHSQPHNTIEKIYDHVMLFAYIPAHTATVQENITDVSANIFPAYALYTYNRFAEQLNVLVLSYKKYINNDGTDIFRKALKSDLFSVIDASTMSAKIHWVYNDSATAHYRAQTGQQKTYEGIPIKMFTDEKGLTTIISQDYEDYDGIAAHPQRKLTEHYFGNIAITQCNDAGEEIWGTVLPVNQCLTGRSGPYFGPEYLNRRWKGQSMVINGPSLFYNRQFCSVNVYQFHQNYYVIYNDYDSNFNNTVANQGKEVYSFETTNACYYKLDQNRIATKHYLLGPPKEHEYANTFLEGADFDEHTGVYASLLQRSGNSKTAYCMSWCQLK